MRSVYIGSATRPDGYFGDTVRVYLVFDNGYLYEVHRYGYHKSPVLPMQFADYIEAAAYIGFNPEAKEFYSDVIYS